jgi:hypothetical protein
MALQIILDRNGDTRHEFDAADPAAVGLAQQRFGELMDRGFRAVVLAKDGSSARLINTFDDKAEQTLFIPQLQGG